MTKSPARMAVEETVISLAQKVITSCENDRPSEARDYASALEDATRALQVAVEADHIDDSA